MRASFITRNIWQTIIYLVYIYLQKCPSRPFLLDILSVTFLKYRYVEETIAENECWRIFPPSISRISVHNRRADFTDNLWYCKVFFGATLPD
jgi:hypothetical protein